MYKKKKKSHLLAQEKIIKKKNQEVRQVPLLKPSKLKISVRGLRNHLKACIKLLLMSKDHG